MGALGLSSTLSGDSSRLSEMMLNPRFLAISLLGICIVMEADPGWNGAELLEVCEALPREPGDLTEQDSVDEAACCSCYINAVHDTSSYYLQNVITPLIQSDSISSRRLKKAGWSSMEEFQETVKLRCLRSDSDLNRSKRTDVVRGFLREHPERLTENAAILVLDALSDASLCQDGSSAAELEPGEHSTAQTRLIDIEPDVPRQGEPVGEATSREASARPKHQTQSIENTPDTGSGPSTKSLETQGNWRALRNAMTTDEVRTLLGEPVRIEIQTRHNRSPRAHWYYSGNSENARVTIREGRVRRLRDWRKVWLVQSWDEPSE